MKPVSLTPPFRSHPAGCDLNPGSLRVWVEALLKPSRFRERFREPTRARTNAEGGFLEAAGSVWRVVSSCVAHVARNEVYDHLRGGTGREVRPTGQNEVAVENMRDVFRPTSASARLLRAQKPVFRGSVGATALDFRKNRDVGGKRRMCAI